MQEGDAGADDEGGAREVVGKVAEELDLEGGGDLGVVHWEADFLPGLAARDLVFGVLVCEAVPHRHERKR